MVVEGRLPAELVQIRGNGLNRPSCWDFVLCTFSVLLHWHGVYGFIGIVE